MNQRLFVYGTLAPGEPNEHILKKLSGRWEKASVKGRLYPLGWGADYGHPGLILDESAESVSGLIFSSDELNDFWRELDEFEGDGYQRVITAISQDDGSLVDAFVYVLKQENEESIKTD